ncbi:periplasmic binding protein-like II [Parathielavia hyrcaniae]|uniref:Periplasmic binding protein-like II n=1 Tax=Parathielavia hyrcaniae TaxID=113614 RepID=A0AAN6PXZ9_9PEZI|nr:periplasmic binding protein-like II [Parathielavia hyrcaniae]
MASTRPLRVGFVPEHFSTPIHFAKKHFGLDAELIPFPSGTGHMITALRSSEIDVGIGLTEGWIAGLGKAQEESKSGDKDGGYRLVGTYVETPLCWAISTGATRPEIKTVDSLQRSRIGVSRIGSGSYVMGYVLADERGWILPTAGIGGSIEQSSPFSDTVVLHTFEKLRQAVNSGEADFFMWEYFTSKRYYDKGEIRKVGEIYTPWSSWKIVASTSLVQQQQGDDVDDKLDPRVDDLLDRLNQGIKHFNENLEEAVQYISTELDYSEEDAREWLKTVRFPKRTQGVDPKVVVSTIELLCKAGVLEVGKGIDANAMIAQKR